MSDGRVSIGIDLGGTEIKGGVVDAAGRLLVERRRRTPAEEGREGLLGALKSLAAELIAEADGAADNVGIGSLGRIDANAGVIVNAPNLPGWTGTRAARELSEVLGLPVYVDNDVNAAAVGEAWVGAAGASRSFAFVALGTGVGGALVHNGQLLHGATGGAGEVGHMLLVPGGHPCNCGQQGCWEQYVSGTALQRMAREINPEWNSRRLMELCEEGQESASQLVDAFVLNLASGLVSVRNMYDPEQIVLGGGVVDSRRAWWEKLERALERQTPKAVPIRPAALGNKAGMIGAARLGELRRVAQERS